MPPKSNSSCLLRILIVGKLQEGWVGVDLSAKIQELYFLTGVPVAAVFWKFVTPPLPAGVRGVGFQTEARSNLWNSGLLSLGRGPETKHEPDEREILGTTTKYPPYPLLWSLGCSMKIFHKGHDLLAAHWTSMPGPSLDLCGQDVQELLQHQQLQNLLLGVHLGLQPLTAQLPEMGECLLGSRCLLITKPSKTLAGELRIGPIFLQRGLPFFF